MSRYHKVKYDVTIDGDDPITFYNEYDVENWIRYYTENRDDLMQLRYYTENRDDPIQLYEMREPTSFNNHIIQISREEVELPNPPDEILDRQDYVKTRLEELRDVIKTLHHDVTIRYSGWRDDEEKYVEIPFEEAAKKRAFADRDFHDSCTRHQNELVNVFTEIADLLYEIQDVTEWLPSQVEC
jgi:hypothetical protein